MDDYFKNAALKKEGRREANRRGTGEWETSRVNAGDEPCRRERDLANVTGEKLGGVLQSEIVKTAAASFTFILPAALMSSDLNTM